MSRSALAVVLAVVLAAVAAFAWLAMSRSGGEPPAVPAAAHPVERDAPVERAIQTAPAPVERVEAGREREPSSAGELDPSSDLHGLLAWLERRSDAPADLVADSARFATRFARVHPERFVRAQDARANLREIAGDGATLLFEPGVWKIGGLVREDGALPDDLTIAGAGREATLLLLEGLRPTGDVARLRVRDCTLSAGDRPLLDATHGFASVELERVRVVGFDGGVGLSPVLRARGLAARWRDCEILGGLGRAPGSGSLFDATGGALAARVERTRIASVRLGLEAWKPHALVRFERCSIEEAIDDPASELGRLAGVSFSTSPIARLAPGARLAPLDLETWFPRWRQRVR
jgi:hypothetical protein